MIIIQLNGEKFQCNADETVSQLLSRIDLDPDKIAVECNKEIITPSSFDHRILAANDVIEIVHFIGGG